MSKKPDTNKTIALEVEPGLHKAVKQAAVEKSITVREFLLPIIKKAVNWKDQ